MKKLLFTIIIVILITSCSKDDESNTIFKIEDNGKLMGKGILPERFDIFVKLAKDRNIAVPKNNMILRYINIQAGGNDSNVYKQGSQLYIDIDEHFISQESPNSEGVLQVILFQQFANGLLNRQFENCGIMWKISTPQDIANRNFNNPNYDNLFNPSIPCN